MFRYIIVFVVFIIVSCNYQVNEIKENLHENTDNMMNELHDSPIYNGTEIEELNEIDTLEEKLIEAGLTDIQTIISDILVEVRYSTTNNFMKQNVYGNLKRIYLQPSVAQDLLKCQNKLKEIDSSLSLLVYDGTRPRSVQQIMWDVLDLPLHEKTKFVSNPKNGSIHNYGAAVDLTIARNDGTPLDMGADYDDIRKIAYPRHEKAYLDSGLLTLKHIENRELLRTVMHAGGFWVIETEWWHFNRYNRTKAKELFKIVE